MLVRRFLFVLLCGACLLRAEAPLAASPVPLGYVVDLVGTWSDQACESQSHRDLHAKTHPPNAKDPGCQVSLGSFIFPDCKLRASRRFRASDSITYRIASTLGLVPFKCNEGVNNCLFPIRLPAIEPKRPSTFLNKLLENLPAANYGQLIGTYSKGSEKARLTDGIALAARRGRPSPVRWTADLGPLFGNWNLPHGPYEVRLCPWPDCGQTNTQTINWSGGTLFVNVLSRPNGVYRFSIRGIEEKRLVLIRLEQDLSSFKSSSENYDAMRTQINGRMSIEDAERDFLLRLTLISPGK